MKPLLARRSRGWWGSLAALLIVQSQFTDSATAQELLDVFAGDPAEVSFGVSLAVPGDLNQDGFDDAVVGVPQGGLNLSGRAIAFDGRTGSILHETVGQRGWDKWGQQVCGLGDVDQDGHPDYLVAAIGNLLPDGEGYVRCISGASGSILYILYGHHAAAFLGVSGRFWRDMNGDGSPELLVGVPGEEVGGVQSVGAVRMYSGWDDLPVLTVYNHIAGETALVELRNSIPSSTVWVGYSLTGPGPQQSPLGEIHLSNPIQTLPVMFTRPHGIARQQVSLPLASAGLSVFLHAVEDGLSGRRLSNPRLIIIQ